MSSSDEEITVDMMLRHPTRVNRFVAELGISDGSPDMLEHIVRYENDPEYRAECDRKNAEHKAEQACIEAERRAALSPWKRWREDNPYFFRKMFPWKIQRWHPPVERDDDDLEESNAVLPGAPAHHDDGGAVEYRVES